MNSRQPPEDSVPPPDLDKSHQQFYVDIPDGLYSLHGSDTVPMGDDGLVDAAPPPAQPGEHQLGGTDAIPETEPKSQEEKKWSAAKKAVVVGGGALATTVVLAVGEFLGANTLLRLLPKVGADGIAADAGPYADGSSNEGKAAFFGGEKSANNIAYDAVKNGHSIVKFNPNNPGDGVIDILVGGMTIRPSENSEQFLLTPIDVEAGKSENSKGVVAGTRTEDGLFLHAEFDSPEDAIQGMTVALEALRNTTDGSITPQADYDDIISPAWLKFIEDSGVDLSKDATIKSRVPLELVESNDGDQELPKDSVSYVTALKHPGDYFEITNTGDEAGAESSIPVEQLQASVDKAGVLVTAETRDGDTLEQTGFAFMLDGMPYILSGSVSINNEPGTIRVELSDGSAVLDRQVSRDEVKYPAGLGETLGEVRGSTSGVQVTEVLLNGAVLDPGSDGLTALGEHLEPVAAGSIDSYEVGDTVYTFTMDPNGVPKFGQARVSSQEDGTNGVSIIGSIDPRGEVVLGTDGELLGVLTVNESGEDPRFNRIDAGLVKNLAGFIQEENQATEGTTETDTGEEEPLVISSEGTVTIDGEEVEVPREILDSMQD